jgi:dihydroflavonol-4-reductase
MAVGDLVLVTGARGFIGKHCVAALLARGYRVRGSLRRATDAAEVRAAVGDLGGGRLEFVVADLLADDGWDAAVAGCGAVLHVASVFPAVAPARRDALVPVAREGTLRVLRAAARAGVARTVVTSSVAAVAVGHPPRAAPFTEADWTNLDNPDVGSYPVSKTLAEQAAWDFVASEGGGMTLAVINPGLVLGPPLDRRVDASAVVVRNLLSGRMLLVPRLDFSVVDVRDIAVAHVAAMEVAAAAGQRFPCVGGMMTLYEMGRVLAGRFPQYRRRLPHGEIPGVVTRAIMAVSPSVRRLLASVGRGPVSSATTERVLGVHFRPPADALVAMAEVLIAA